MICSGGFSPSSASASDDTALNGGVLLNLTETISVGVNAAFDGDLNVYRVAGRSYLPLPDAVQPSKPSRRYSRAQIEVNRKPSNKVPLTDTRMCKPLSGSFLIRSTSSRCWLSEGIHINGVLARTCNMLTIRMGSVGANKTTLSQVCASL